MINLIDKHNIIDSIPKYKIDTKMDQFKCIINIGVNLNNITWIYQTLMIIIITINKQYQKMVQCVFKVN